MTPDRAKALARAKRWARRGPAHAARSKPEAMRCWRHMMSAIYEFLPPMRDGTKPRGGALL